MQRELELDGNYTVAKIVSDLSQAYNFAEHEEPDAVILSLCLSDCPEFELLASLLRILGIGCIVVGAAQTTQSSPRIPSVSYLADRQVGPHLRSATAEVCCRSHCNVKTPLPNMIEQEFDPRKLILIGASTGGVDALLSVLKNFTPTCPPTLIVQHTGGQFAKSLVKLLNSRTAAKVEPAVSGTRPKPGHIYLAPDDTAHLRLAVGRTKRMEVWQGEPVMGHRPSVDAMFESAVPFGADIIAAILTGMGRDGATGLTALRSAGARTFGQNQQTSVVYGMPRVAYELGGVETQLPINEIGPALLSAAKIRTIA